MGHPYPIFCLCVFLWGPSDSAHGFGCLQLEGLGGGVPKTFWQVEGSSVEGLGTLTGEGGGGEGEALILIVRTGLNKAYLRKDSPLPHKPKCHQGRGRH